MLIRALQMRAHLIDSGQCKVCFERITFTTVYVGHAMYPDHVLILLVGRLTCGHYFCRPCIQRVRGGDSPGNSKYTCAVCDEEGEIVSGLGSALDEILAILQNDMCVYGTEAEGWLNPANPEMGYLTIAMRLRQTDNERDREGA